MTKYTKNMEIKKKLPAMTQHKHNLHNLWADQVKKKNMNMNFIVDLQFLYGI